MPSPLSAPSQRLVWQQPHPVPDTWCAVDIDGPLDRPLLRLQVAAAVARHGMLRDAGVTNADVGWRQAEVPIDVGPDGAVAAVLRHDAGVRTPPLRATLIAWAADRHLLVLSAPADRADRRSLHLLVEEIIAGYAGQPSQPPGADYESFAAWCNLLAEDRYEVDAVLAGLDGVETMAFEEAATAAAGQTTAEVDIDVPAGRSADELASLILASWYAVRWRQTGRTVLGTGWVADGRLVEELARLIGPAMTHLPLVHRIAGPDRIAALARRIRDDVADAVGAPSFLPLPSGVTATVPAHGFEWVFEPPPTTVARTRFAIREDGDWTGPYRMMLVARRRTEGVRLSLVAARGRFGPDLIRSTIDQIAAGVADALARPDATIADLATMTEAERHRLVVETNRTEADFPQDSGTHHLVEQIAAASPDRPAVTSAGVTLSYGEINRAAETLAARLRRLGALNETLVGILVGRTAHLIVAMLAVHKAGAAYVPIDPAHPTARIESIVADTGMSLAFADSTHAARLTGLLTVIMVDKDDHGGSPPVPMLPPVPIDADALAYVRHTSGSTGRPKGVQVSHRSLVNFFTSMARRPGLAAHDVVVAVTTAAFDISEVELYLPLTVGAQVVIASRETAADPRALGRVLAETGATVLQATPVTWRMLVDSGWPGLPGLTALIGGEAVPPGLAKQIRPLVGRLFNMYGPTETTIWSTIAELEPPGPVAVGRPIANTCIHVLDDRWGPTPVGVLGEVVIGGEGVARGYLRRPGLTAERFVPDPFGCHGPGSRVYLTGDFGRYDPDGNLHLAGRRDGQVKIRGFRVELGEVENVLAGHPSVSAAVVTTRPEPSGSLRLEAHVVPVAGVRPTPAELRAWLGERLPVAMVPGRVRLTGDLPLTANGKIDRGALPEIGAAEGGGAGPVAISGLEKAVADIWREVLTVAEPGTSDNFFDLGGHSLALVQVSSLLAERLGAEVTPVVLLDHPTIATLARHLAERPVGGEAVQASAGDVADPVRGRERLRRRRALADEQ